MPKLMKLSKSVDNQYITLLLLILLFATCNPKKETNTQNEVEVVNQDSTLRNIEFYNGDADFTLVFIKDSVRRVLSFRRSKDSTDYQYINYQSSQNQKLILEEEIQYINKLWRLAEDSISIVPKGIMVGYPLEYSDVLRNHIEALKDIDSFDINNYDTLRSIMLKKHVYQPLEAYLKTKRYKLNKISTEKHGYVPEEDLIELGYSDTLKIPVPFMVWLEIKPAN